MWKTYKALAYSILGMQSPIMLSEKCISLGTQSIITALLSSPLKEKMSMATITV